MTFKKMIFLKHKEDTLPVTLITLLCVLDLTVFFLVENLWLIAAWALLGLAPKACICSWNHHHQHVPTFKQNWLNRCLELVYALHTGITTNAWVLHHNLGHHVNYLDQTKDESRWQRKDGSTMGAIEYTLYLAYTGYFDAYKVGKNYPRFQKSFLQMGVFTTILVTALTIYNWQNALLIFILPMAVGYLTTCLHTYYHHAGLDTKNHLEASYNITHKWYNILTGNLGYHTAHHMKQALHWSKLPELHAQIEADIPQDLFRSPCIPFKWMPAN